MNILIVEDDPDLRSSIRDYLVQGGFSCSVAGNLFRAEDLLIEHSYDLVVLDIGLPDGNGLTLISLIKKEYQDTAVLVLSARDSLQDKLTGLDLGADDYLTKPFHLAELNSRINAIIRRKSHEGRDQIQFNEISLDHQLKEALVNNKSLKLTIREFELLGYLISNRHRVITREGIAEHLWGPENDHDDHLEILYTHIKNLRKKIKVAGGKDYLQTVYGIGYKFTDQ